MIDLANEEEKYEVLLVDDDRFILKALTKLITQKFDFIEITGVENFHEVKRVISERLFSLAICDYHLPDAEKGEAIDFLLMHKVPVIVLTASYDESLREKILEKGVVDYLIKGIPNIGEHILSAVKRVFSNLKTKVLVVEDVEVDRKIIVNILKNMLFQIFEANSISKAREILRENSDIRLIILDYYFPEEDALDFIYEIRKRYSKDDLGIIVVSGIAKTSLIPIFLKAGANDFLRKPFSKEELVVRINNMLDFLDLIEELEFYAYHDPLTGLYNRRYFFEEAPKIWYIAKRQNLKLACIMIDIDNFKKINDIYGHEIGDLVLKDLAKKLRLYFKRKEDIIARLGGEEFAILTIFSEAEKFIPYVENFLKIVRENPLEIREGDVIYYTISVGVELELKNNFKEMLTSADKKLYEAKHKGKDTLVI